MKLSANWIWLGPPMPEEYLDNITQFKVLNPDMDARLWTEGSLAYLTFLPKIWADLEEHTPEDSFRQLQSDLARLAILYEFGGLYVDADFTWQKPIIDLLHPSKVTTVWETPKVHVANGFIYAPQPKHPVIGRALVTAEAWIRSRSGRRANRILGPSGQWTHLTAQNPNVHRLQTELLLPYAWNEPERENEEFPNAYGIHRWSHQASLRMKGASHA